MPQTIAAIVIGALWNGVDAPPSAMDGEGENNLKMLRSRNGITFTMDDRKGQEQLVLQTPGGQRVTLKDGPGTLHIEDSNGNTIAMGAAGITITASIQVTVNADQVNITAGTLTVDVGVAKFSGTVMADTVICKSVVSDSYTPGAGNIW